MKNASMIFAIGLVLSFAAALCCAQEERAALQQRWIDRAIETTLAVISDPSIVDYEKNYSVGMTSLALGQIGSVAKAKEIVR